MHKATQPDLQVEPISRFALLANAIPLLTIVVIVSVATVLTTGVLGWAATFVALLYVLPPVTARIVMALFGKPQGRDLRQDSTAFKVWWVLLQLQMPFNRIPWLEELLRLVPGLYPFWLNLWGATHSLAGRTATAGAGAVPVLVEPVGCQGQPGLILGAGCPQSGPALS